MAALWSMGFVSVCACDKWARQKMCRFMRLCVCMLALGVALGDPCNPRLERGCFAANLALGTRIEEPLTVCPAQFHAKFFAQNVAHDDLGAALTIYDRYENPAIASDFYILYGSVSAEIMASQGRGIVSSLYLQSDDLDEIDVMEVLGSVPQMAQTNFFVKGEVQNYEHGMSHASPDGDNFVLFGVDWTPLAITWSVNGEVVRVAANEVHSPMVVILSLWAGGDVDNDAGTIEWAGGVTDYKKAPFVMRARNLRVEDYSTGTHYVYGNVAGQWLQLNSRGGRIFNCGMQDDVLVPLSSEQLARYDQFEGGATEGTDNEAETGHEDTGSDSDSSSDEYEEEADCAEGGTSVDAFDVGAQLHDVSAAGSPQITHVGANVVAAVPNALLRLQRMVLTEAAAASTYTNGANPSLRQDALVLKLISAFLRIGARDQ